MASIDELPPAAAVFLDVTPRQVLALAGHRLPKGYCRRLARYRYGPAAFKIDWALNGSIPWRAAACLRAATVHLSVVVSVFFGGFNDLRHVPVIVRVVDSLDAGEDALLHPRPRVEPPGGLAKAQWSERRAIVRTNGEDARLAVARLDEDFAVRRGKVAVEQQDAEAVELAVTDEHGPDLVHALEIVVRDVGRVVDVRKLHD